MFCFPMDPCQGSLVLLLPWVFLLPRRFEGGYRDTRWRNVQRVDLASSRRHVFAEEKRDVHGGNSRRLMPLELRVIQVVVAAGGQK